MALPVYVPLGYFAFLVGLLWLFSRYYRAKSLRKHTPPPWFTEPHTARDVYISLLSLDPPPPQSTLVASLLVRAAADVRRIWTLRDSKQALTTLQQKGQIGDELWERLLLAEKELEAEIVEVVGEANEYAAGWGQAIFAIANETATALKNREVLQNIPTERELMTTRLLELLPDNIAPGHLTIAQHLDSTSLQTSSLSK